MTDNNLNKYITIPKTYEVKYVENKNSQSLSKIATFLGLNQVECSGTNDNSCKEVEKATSSSKGSFTDEEKVSSVKTLDKASNQIENRANLEDEKKSGNEHSGDYHSESIKYKPRK
jgi:hypothetical protein